ncbi:hypothetical protein [Verrucosispora sp. NA02020]|uniref:hypothetical protein n=1 Tax=Verrucosispora sp. NA02020 TaxID=2742132 RepID=UPI003D7082A5
MDDPYPPASPVPDGDRELRPWPRESLPRRHLAAGWLVAGIVLLVMVAGIAGWLS